MGRRLNEGIEDGRRAWAITTIGLFTLVTSSGLIGAPLFGYMYGDMKLDCALREFSIASAGSALPWSFNCREQVQLQV